jgi:hypothetical protein
MSPALFAETMEGRKDLVVLVVDFGILFFNDI